MENKKVILPLYVAKALDELGVDSWSPFGLLMKVKAYKDINDDVYRQFVSSDNQWKLLQALEWGYEVEKEQLYYILFGDYDTFNNSESFLNLDRGDNTLFVTGRDEDEDYKTKFTMDEIKSLGEKYVPFAIKVEEIDGEQ